jgi:hypothetical protein
MTLTIRLIPALVLLAACVPEVPPPPGPPPVGGGRCGAEQLQGLVGQPASVLEKMRFAPPTRIIRPGQPVTEDYSEDRLNIAINRAEQIESVTCG